MIGDVVVGAITSLAVQDWHANVEVSVRPDVVVPANAQATIGQTSLLGSMHLALDPPPGEQATGRLKPGSTIALNRSSTYPSTEQTLASVSSLINGGGIAHFGDIVHNLNAALNGHEDQFRDLLAQFNDFIGVLDGQRGKTVELIDGLNRLTATLASSSGSIDRALRAIPAAMEVLDRERPNITTALVKLGHFGDLATRLVNDSKADLVTNLQNLGPVTQSIADVGPELAAAVVGVTTYPYTQNFIDRAIRGDYMNTFAVIDLTAPRLKSGLFQGTRWGQTTPQVVPAPGDPESLNYTYDPLKSPIAGPPPPVEAPSVPGTPDTTGPAAAPAPQTPPGPTPPEAGGR
jgi:phospholipid/cholesterol/gamma-HCH transport system substrate-binding protein